MLNYEFPPLWAGAANATYNLLSEFALNSSLEIVLITSSLGEFKKEQFASNITIYYLDIFKNNKNKHYQSIKDLLIYSWKSYFFAKKLLKKQQFDLIHAFFGIPCWYIAMKLSQLFHIPYIVSLRGSDVPFYSKRFYFLDRFFFKKLSRKIRANASSVFTNSDWLRQLALKSIPDQKIGVIYNGVEIISSTKKKDKNYFTLLYVGRLIERKWVKELIQAYNTFSKHTSDTRLWIVWSGNLHHTLTQLANWNPAITFWWDKLHHEVIDFYAQSDVYILPSKNEWMSNTLLESMTAKLPVIITDTWWTKELFCDNGWILKDDNISDISSKIWLAYQEWKQWKLTKLWLKSFEKVESFSWKNMAKLYHTCYTKIITSPFI